MRSNRARARVLLVALVSAIGLVGLLVWPAPEAAMAADTDGDGLSDDFEQAIGTDPNVSDSDGDGLSDFEEIFGTGTDPLEPDTDGDGTDDDVDSDPLGGDTYPGGAEDADGNYTPGDSPKEARTGVSPVEGVGIYVHNGEFVFRQPLLRVRGRRMDMAFTITYRSQIEHDGIVGHNWFLFPEIREQGSGDVDYLSDGVRYTFDKDTEDANEVTYDSPAGFAGTLVKDKTSDEWELTFPNGYTEVFNADDTDEDIPEGGITSRGYPDRWNVSISFTWSDEQITTVTDDRGKTYSLDYYDVGVIQEPDVRTSHIVDVHYANRYYDCFSRAD